MKSIEKKKESLENALYKWLDEVENVEQDILDLLEHNDISRAQIAKGIDAMKNKLVTLENNLRRY